MKKNVNRKHVKVRLKRLSLIKTHASLPTMSLNSLYLSQSNPQPECNHMARNHGGPKKRWNPKYQNLSPVRIWCCVSYRCCVFMVNFMNFFIPPLSMQKSMYPIIREVFNKKINKQLRNDLH